MRSDPAIPARVGVPAVESPEFVSQDRALAEYGFAQVRYWHGQGDKARADAWQGWASPFFVRAMARSPAEAAARRREAVMRLWQAGKSAAEIAAAVGCTEDAVRKIAHRARKAGDERAVKRGGGRGPEPCAEVACRNSRILDAWAAGESGKVIARRFGVSPQTVWIAVFNARQAGDARAVRRKQKRATPRGIAAGASGGGVDPGPAAAGLPSGTAAGDAPGGLVTSGLRSSSWHAAAPGGGGEAHSAARQHNEQHDQLGAEHQNSEREQQVVLPPLARSVVVVSSGQVSRSSLHAGNVQETSQ